MTEMVERTKTEIEKTVITRKLKGKIDNYPPISGKEWTDGCCSAWVFFEVSVFSGVDFLWKTLMFPTGEIWNNGLHFIWKWPFNNPSFLFFTGLQRVLWKRSFSYKPFHLLFHLLDCIAIGEFGGFGGNVNTSKSLHSSHKSSGIHMDGRTQDFPSRKLPESSHCLCWLAHFPQWILMPGVPQVNDAHAPCVIHQYIIYIHSA